MAKTDWMQVTFENIGTGDVTLTDKITRPVSVLVHAVKTGKLPAEEVLRFGREKMDEVVPLWLSRPATYGELFLTKWLIKNEVEALMAQEQYDASDYEELAKVAGD